MCIKKWRRIVPAITLAVIMAVTAGGCSLFAGKKPGSTTAWSDTVNELMTRPTKIILVMKAPETQTDNVAIAGTNWEVTLDKYIGTQTDRPVQVDIQLGSDLYSVKLTLEDGTVHTMDGSLSPGKIELYLNATVDATPAQSGIKAVVTVNNIGGRGVFCQINDNPGGRITLNDRDSYPITGTSEKENLTIVE